MPRSLAFALAACALGCAPLAEMRPASGMIEGRNFEVGGAYVELGPRKYVVEPSATTGQLWFSARASSLFSFTALTAFDRNAAGFGGAARLTPLHTRRFAAAVETQLGYAWGALLLPLALRLFDETWVYASPRLGTFGRHFSFGAPVGISIRIYDGFVIRLEVQTSWEDFKYYNRRVHTAMGAAYQW